MRLVVKEVLMGDDNIVIRHCIPIPQDPRKMAVRPLPPSEDPRRPKLPFA